MQGPFVCRANVFSTIITSGCVTGWLSGRMLHVLPLPPLFNPAVNLTTFNALMVGNLLIALLQHQPPIRDPFTYFHARWYHVCCYHAIISIVINVLRNTLKSLLKFKVNKFMLNKNTST